LPVFRHWFDDALRSGGALVAVSQGDSRLIGTSRFGLFDPGRSEIEIGWTFIARAHWGGPYNADRKRLMVRHTFGSVQTVIFRVHTLNSRSQRAVEKLGAASVRSPMRKGAARTTCSDLKRRYIPRRAKPSKAKTGPGQNPE
jgi:RimJ/RimL family protein N-acetyltransferase